MFIVIDVFVGNFFYGLYNTSKSGIVYQENYIFNKSTEDLLIFGSSRASFHYRADIIEECTSLKAYNAGREGYGIHFHNAVLISTVDRYLPITVLLDLDFRDVFDRGGSFSNDVFYEIAPFYNKINSEFDDYISPRWYDKFFFLSNLFKYNKKFFSLISSNMVENNDFNKGYRPLEGVWNGKEKDIKGINIFNLSLELINEVDKFIVTAKENGVNVVLVVSPTFKKIDDRFYVVLEQLKQKHNIGLLDYSRNNLFLDNIEYFHDSEHLNSKGAEYFTKKLCEDIKDIEF